MPVPSVDRLDPNSKAHAELTRLRESELRTRNWKRWGPYLPERQWGTVREDYSADGDCWNYFPHEQARSRAYRWGEDGLLGICDRQCRLCFAVALWNGQDPYLKERLFGVTNPQGNHGEDVKEEYFYLDSSPSHAYLKALYKYPQRAYPYDELLAENARRTWEQPEYELADTGVFDEDRYFDVAVEYAKGGPDDLLIRLTVTNRGPDAAPLHLLPTLWFRNTWAWGRPEDEGHWPRPNMQLASDATLTSDHASLGRFTLTAGPASDGSDFTWLFTENETHGERLFNLPSVGPYVKDAFHRHVVNGEAAAVNPAQQGTKAAAWYTLNIPAGASVTVRLRLTGADEKVRGKPLGPSFDKTFTQRREETNSFYDWLLPEHLDAAARLVARQGYAGLLWTKQFYHYVIEQWLHGDPATPAPPAKRVEGRNHDWGHLYNRDVMAVPDKWEYPWYAAWDLAFHMVPFAKLDPEFTKQQLLLMLREWYLHPNGQMPAYEFNFSDVNPPVHAWACWRAYQICDVGECDRKFLERTFQKLLLNFTWWVNRKDREGNHIFAGGFLGLDNIGVFDRSRPLHPTHHLEQADGTAWMAFYCGTMLTMALELAEPENAYADMASKFLEHCVHITDAINSLGGSGLWDERDGFYYDQLHVDGQPQRMRIRSLVGLIPMLAVQIIPESVMNRLPGFRKRTEWFLRHHHAMSSQMTYRKDPDTGQGQYLLALPSRERLERLLGYLLDENEFLSPYGIRSLSRYHLEHPFELKLNGTAHRVGYEPGETQSQLFGGNSNWRGPVWFPLNYLIIEALERYHVFYGDSLTVECPVGSGQRMNLGQVAAELRRRLTLLLLPDAKGARPALVGERFAGQPSEGELLLFHEYFHGDTGRGLGANHQTGWTALVTQCL